MFISLNMAFSNKLSYLEIEISHRKFLCEPNYVAFPTFCWVPKILDAFFVVHAIVDLLDRLNAKKFKPFFGLFPGQTNVLVIPD